MGRKKKEDIENVEVVENIKEKNEIKEGKTDQQIKDEVKDKESACEQSHVECGDKHVAKKRHLLQVAHDPVNCNSSHKHLK